MKRIITYLVSALMLLSLASCHKSSRIFSETAAERTEERIELCRNALVARGTWVMEYFPDEDLRYGGWIYVLEFSPDYTVKVWFEGAGFIPQADPVTESEYKVELGTGPMLKFCTNNDYIHFFSFPGGPNGGGYRGWGGDHEFTIMSISDNYDEIIMKGLKSFNRIRLTPLPGDETPEGYIAKVHASEKAVTRKSFDLCVNGKVIGTATRETLSDFNNYERFYKSKIWTLSYEMPVQANDENGNPMTDENGNPVYKSEKVVENVCAINLPDGVMKLYKPYTFKGNCVEGLDGQTVGTFRWTPGVFSSNDYYSGTDSFYQITLQ